MCSGEERVQGQEENYTGKISDSKQVVLKNILQTIIYNFVTIFMCTVYDMVKIMILKDNVNCFAYQLK